MKVPMSVRVAALAALLVCASAQQAPAPGPLPYMVPNGVQPGGTVTSPNTSPSPSSSATSGQAGPASPATTSAPLAAPTVSFVTRSSIDNPTVFLTSNIPGTSTTYHDAWIQNLQNQFPGSVATATATSGSVNIATTVTFPITSSSSPSTAAQSFSKLTAALQTAASNPSASGLFPSTLNFGSITVSGISVSGNLPAFAPAPAPVLAPIVVARSISFKAFLTSFASPNAFYPYQAQWCANIQSVYPTSTCSVPSVQPGSVVVTTILGFAANDPASSAALAQLQAIANGASSSSLFGAQFEPVTVSAVADSSSTPATTASTPPPPTSKHHLSGGAIAGAVIGSIVGAALLACLGFFGYKYYKSRRAYSPAQMA